jgi:hypothetical protein
MNLRLPTNWWRFSIRELLLLTAAAAAFLAWAGLMFQKSRPYVRTRVPDLVGNAQDARAICLALGHRSSSSSSSGGGGSNPYETTRSYDFHIDLPADQRGAFMAAYRDHIKGVLDKEADKVWGAGSASDGGGLRSFDYEYAKDRTHGKVVVRCASGGDLTLFVFVHEHDTRR